MRGGPGAGAADMRSREDFGTWAPAKVFARMHVAPARGSVGAIGPGATAQWHIDGGYAQLPVDVEQAIANAESGGGVTG